MRADKGHRIDSLLRAVVVWSFLFRALSPSAQTSPATLPNIQISSAGRVNAIVVQEGGKVIIGGDFSSVNGVPRQNIARINANGSVDETWNPGASSSGGIPVASLVMAGNDLFVCGDFTAIGGVLREGLAKLSTESEPVVDANWNPELPLSSKSALALNGIDLYVGGHDFERSRGLLAKVSIFGTGAVDTVWAPRVNSGEVSALAVSGEDIYAGGSFREIDGSKRNGLAKLSTLGTGEVDTDWDPQAAGDASTGSPTGPLIMSLVLKEANLYVGGSFINIRGQSQTNLAKLDAQGNGAADPLWNPSPDGSVLTMAVAGNDVYVGGEFGSVGGLRKPKLAKVSASGDGEPDRFWDPEPDGLVSAIAIDGARVLVGGAFESMRGKAALSLAKLGLFTGLRDDEFPVQVGHPGYIAAVARQADGKVVIGGDFALVGGLRRKNLARFNSEGTIDAAWDPSADSFVRAIVVGGSDMFVGGDFSRVGGLERRALAKVSAAGTGSADPLWNPNPEFRLAPNPSVDLLALSGTNLYAAGEFYTIGGLDRPFLAKIATIGAGECDPGWNANVNLLLRPIHQPFESMIANDTDLFVTGRFTIRGNSIFQESFTNSAIAKLSRSLRGAPDPEWNPNGIVRGVFGRLALSGTDLYVGGSGLRVGIQDTTELHGLVKLTTSGAGLVDPLWNPPLARSDSALLALSGTNLFAAGVFTNQAGQSFSTIAKLSTSGSGDVDWTWTFPSIDPQYYLQAPLALGADIYVVGDFTAVGGQPREGFALYAVADAPSMIKRSATNFVVLRNLNDSYEVTHFRITGITNGACYQSDGLTRVNVGDFITVREGETGLIFVGATNGTVTAVSSLNATTNGTGTASTTLNFGVSQGPVFSFSSGNYSISEQGRAVRVTVQKWGSGASSVSLTIADGTAVAYDFDSDTGDYSPVSARLSFPAGETNKTFDIFIHDDQVFTGDRTFWIALADPTGGGQLAYPAAAAITIVEDDRFGATESVTANQLPAPLPPANLTGALRVYLEPAAAHGQWRLAGELLWRTSGELVGGLLTDNYIVEFKSVTNYYDLGNLQVPVLAGQTRQVTNSYAAQSVLEAGQLTMVINPPSVATNRDINLRGQWRLTGETDWHDSGHTISNLNAGGLIVEFKSITNFVKPFNLEVTVFGRVNNRVKAEYSVKTVSGGLLPRVLNFSEVSDTEWPYVYNGQLQTDAGLSSGVVVKERVVLTAAHALFNDNTFEWVTDARWFFQKHLGDYLPVPRRPRGWYVVGSYSAQRSNDKPGFSTLESKQLDAATLYFTETDYDANKPGRGGYGGYLFSDAGAYNEHLISGQNKFLVGYPLVPAAETNWGRMYATTPTNLHFTSLDPKVFRTTDILSFPGNSGGPLYVQWTNGEYYPAGIYLGEASQTLLRAIDGEVVDLINRAEASGNGGGNFNGGGVITISPLYTAATFASGSVQVRLGPPAAVAAGGAWRVSARNIDYTTNLNEKIPLVGGGEFLIEFRPVTGWLLPTNQVVGVAADQETILDAYYVDARPSLIYRLEEGMSRLSLSGATGASYRVESAADLTMPITWTPFTTITLSNTPSAISNTQPTHTGSRFFRAVLVP